MHGVNLKLRSRFLNAYNDLSTVVFHSDIKGSKFLESIEHLNSSEFSKITSFRIFAENLHVTHNVSSQMFVQNLIKPSFKPTNLDFHPSIFCKDPFVRKKIKNSWKIIFIQLWLNYIFQTCKWGPTSVQPRDEGHLPGQVTEADLWRQKVI